MAFSGAVSIHSMHFNLAVVKRKCPAYNNSCMSEKNVAMRLQKYIKTWKHVFLCRCWLLTACQWIASHTPFQNDSKTLIFHADHTLQLCGLFATISGWSSLSWKFPRNLSAQMQQSQQSVKGEVFILGTFFFFFWFLFSFFGPLVSCSSNPLVPWSSRHRHLVPLLSGPRCPGLLVRWSPGPLVFWSPGPLFLFRFFFSNLSFALFHYLFYIFTLSFVYVYVSFVSLVFVCVIFMLL